MVDWLSIASGWQSWPSESTLDGLLYEPGVYILLNLAGRPVYIGQSSDIARRIEEHRLGTSSIEDRYNTKPKDFHRAVFFRLSSLSDRLRLEGILILALAPSLNRALLLRLSEGEEGTPTVSQLPASEVWRPRQGARRRVAPRSAGRGTRDSGLRPSRPRRANRRSATERSDELP